MNVTKSWKSLSKTLYQLNAEGGVERISECYCGTPVCMVPIVCLIPKKEKVRRAVRHRPRCVPLVGKEIFRRGASPLAQDDNGM